MTRRRISVTTGSPPPKPAINEVDRLERVLHQIATERQHAALRKRLAAMAGLRSFKHLARSYYEAIDADTLTFTAYDLLGLGELDAPGTFSMLFSGVPPRAVWPDLGLVGRQRPTKAMHKAAADMKRLFLFLEATPPQGEPLH